MLPEQIEQMESGIGNLQLKIAEPAFYASEQTLVQSVLQDLASRQQELEIAIGRWSELEERQQQYESGRT